MVAYLGAKNTDEDPKHFLNEHGLIEFDGNVDPVSLFQFFKQFEHSVTSLNKERKKQGLNPLNLARRTGGKPQLRENDVLSLLPKSPQQMPAPYMTMNESSKVVYDNFVSNLRQMSNAPQEIYKAPDGSTRKRFVKEARKESAAAVGLGMQPSVQVSPPVVIDIEDDVKVVDTNAGVCHTAWMTQVVPIDCCGKAYDVKLLVCLTDHKKVAVKVGKISARDANDVSMRESSNNRSANARTSSANRQMKE
jgi:hypothetical protein